MLSERRSRKRERAKTRKKGERPLAGSERVACGHAEPDNSSPSVSPFRPFVFSRSSSALRVTSSRAELFPAVVEIRRWYSLNLNIVGCFRKDDRESAKGRKRERRVSDRWQEANVSRAATRSLITLRRLFRPFALSPFRDPLPRRGSRHRVRNYSRRSLKSAKTPRFLREE
jgi:hypothetical protein